MEFIAGMLVNSPIAKTEKIFDSKLVSVSSFANIQVFRFLFTNLGIFVILEKLAGFVHRVAQTVRFHA